MLHRPVLSAVFAAMLAGAAPALADYDAGQRAWDAGNPTAALAEWHAAADAGDRRAMLALGRLYLQGLGAPQDYVEAHKWFNLAASRGAVEAVAERDALAAKTTPAQVAAAQGRAAAWRPGGEASAAAEAEAPAKRPAATSAEAGPPPPRVVIREAQELLAALGYAPGPADGLWGQRTAVAYRSFLRDADLPAVEALMPETLQALREVAASHGAGDASASEESALRPGVSLAEAEAKAEERARLAGMAGAVFRECSECPEMVVVAAGEFMMGSPPSEEGRYDDEGPVHRVTISEPFAVGKYEVTRGEFASFVSATGRSTGDSCFVYEGGEWNWSSGRGWRSPGFSQTDRDPVVCVSWDDARSYVSWLSGETGEDYRLLSEAEWEYAARAGTRTRYHWGDDLGRKRANCFVVYCEDGWDHTAPVGSFEPNGFGLHDVHGNVWEWVEDCWNGDYVGAPSDGSAWESGYCHLRVLRGGSWIDLPRDLRAALRAVGTSPVFRIGFFGFRVARTLAR